MRDITLNKEFFGNFFKINKTKIVLIPIFTIIYGISFLSVASSALGNSDYNLVTNIILWMLFAPTVLFGFLSVILPQGLILGAIINIYLWVCFVDFFIKLVFRQPKVYVQESLDIKPIYNNLEKNTE